ncbi:MAG TPA: hypothetical protein VMG32_03105 [Anaeromyxobacteraceae bacterium]|nr:hypothetical protein [Anaeromyxobacteraceae bacterium]
MSSLVFVLWVSGLVLAIALRVAVHRRARRPPVRRGSPKGAPAAPGRGP